MVGVGNGQELNPEAESPNPEGEWREKKQDHDGGGSERPFHPALISSDRHARAVGRGEAAVAHCGVTFFQRPLSLSHGG